MTDFATTFAAKHLQDQIEMEHLCGQNFLQLRPKAGFRLLFFAVLMPCRLCLFQLPL
jgi:hypothetical protein